MNIYTNQSKGVIKKLRMTTSESTSEHFAKIRETDVRISQYEDKKRIIIVGNEPLTYMVKIMFITCVTHRRGGRNMS